MSTTSSITPNLPEFPYSPVTDARRHLSSLLSSSHFVTTVVSPPPLPSASHPLTPFCADREDNPDPPLTADSSSTEIALHPPAASQIPSVTSQLQSSKHSPPRPQSPSVSIEPALLKSLNQAPSRAYSYKYPLVPIRTGQDCLDWPPHPRRRSAWHRFKRMGNHLVTPLRSMGLCFSSCTGGHCAVAFCEDFSSQDASPGSSWCSSGEYPPDFIRAVLENNVLIGQLAVA